MAPVLSGDFVAFGATPKRHLHSPQSTLEFRSVTAVEDRREMGALHSPIREDCGLGRDDCDAWSEDSTCTLPFTPERGAPPSYEHVMTSPMPVGPPFDCCHNFSVLVHLNSLQKENIVCFILRRHTNAKNLFRLCRPRRFFSSTPRSTCRGYLHSCLRGGAGRETYLR